MDTVYLGIVLFLFILAIFDLSVGVSNDAVNFLNSAIGAKTATFRTIIIIAAIGVFCGASMSNGMMEIARHGIFRPEQFYFNELMYIFLAVMVTDIVLLDIFNSLGMPTSTTVSMVFELLGGTFALTLVKLFNDASGTLSIADLMNTEKALSVIMGIFVSVAIAFFFGTLVQFLSRLLFSFNYKRGLTWKIGLFGGAAATSIIYFMLIKGVKDLTFMTPDAKAYIHDHTWLIVGSCFVGFSLLMQLLHALKVNVFKVIVLMGTFALATAFAGNDLVNFIGVPLAGFASYTDYVANGQGDPSGLLMTSLNAPARTPMFFLVAAGAIMVYSLATSKKAYNVVKTSVDLSRQDEGEEMFGSSRMARSLVRSFTNLSSWVVRITPESVKQWVNSRMNKEEAVMAEGAAFDMVRASVNLVLAGLLIALGTSLKLPLSTTYVTFMVAMGTSLADRAWGRESAVFRITGVLSVIGGWFITAGAAFILCFLVVMAMYFGGLVVAIGLAIASVVILIRSNIRYNKRMKEEQSDDLFQRIMATKDHQEALVLLQQHIARNEEECMAYVAQMYAQLTDGFIHEDLRNLRRAGHSMKNRKTLLKNVRRKELVGMRRIDKSIAIEKNTWFHLATNSCQQILYSLMRISEPIQEHVDNHFLPLPQERVDEFLPLRNELMHLFNCTQFLIARGDYAAVDTLREECDVLKSNLSRLRKQQMDRMQDVSENLSVSYVYLSLLQESQEIVSSLRHLLRAARNFQAA